MIIIKRQKNLSVMTIEKSVVNRLIADCEIKVQIAFEIVNIDIY